MIAKTQYKTALREHQIYALLQRLLIALVQEAIHNKYTNTIRKLITGQVPGDICILKYHFGKINDNELQTNYDEITNMSYNVSGYIRDIFNAVEDLCEIAESAQTPYYPRQQVSIG